MAESETNLGTIQSLLERLILEVQSLRDEISSDSVTNNPLFDMPLQLWYDRLPRLGDYDELILPEANLSDKSNLAVNDKSCIPELFDRHGVNFDMKSIDTFNETDAQYNNLYFIELRQVHHGVPDLLNYANPRVLDLIKQKRLAVVWWFPHEGFAFDSLKDSEDRGWLDRLVDAIEAWGLDRGVHYLVYGDLHAKVNYVRWKDHRENKKFKFKKVFGLDWFHEHYFRQYTSRTAWRFNPRYDDTSFRDYDTYGHCESTNFREKYIDLRDMPDGWRQTAAAVSTRGWYDIYWPDSDQHRLVMLDEVMEDIPSPAMKDRDLVCLNARARYQRPVIVSELFRLGYDNKNSFISFLARDEELHDNPKHHWKHKCFSEGPWKGEADLKIWMEKSNTPYIDLLPYNVQKEYFYKFWQKHDIIECDIDTREVQGDDRQITKEHYERSYFALVSETLFGSGDTFSLQVTEKIYKAIAYRIPFMVVGSAGTLSYLRKLGYETFPEFFDESYDTMQDPTKRMQCIIKNLERWRLYTEEEKRKLYQGVMAKLYRNYEHFKRCGKARTFEFENIFNQLKLHG